MASLEPFPLPHPLPFAIEHSGLFISRGRGTHPTRTIASCELIYVRSGRLGIREEARHYDLGPGEALLLRAGREHGGTAPYPADLSFYWLHFTPRESTAASAGTSPERPARRARAAAKHTAAAAANTLTGPFALASRTLVARPDRLTQLLHLFLDDQEANQPVHLREALLVLILHEAATARHLATDTPPGNLSGHAILDPASANAAAARRADRIEQYIRTHFHLPMTTADIAQALDANPDYLGRLYRQVFHRTITEGIHTQRLNSARQQLIMSDGNIAAIARDCGFPDPGYFGRIFRRATGLSPQAYRRQHARVHYNTE